MIYGQWLIILFWFGNFPLGFYYLGWHVAKKLIIDKTQQDKKTQKNWKFVATVEAALQFVKDQVASLTAIGNQMKTPCE